MGTRIDNEFTSYEFLPEEALQAQIFNPIQVQWLQTRLASLMVKKNMLTFDPNNVNQYIQQEAELQGQIRLLQQLLLDSETALETVRLNQNVRNESADNPEFVLDNRSAIDFSTNSPE